MRSSAQSFEMVFMFQQQVFQLLAIVARLLPQAALHGFEQALQHVAQGLRIVLHEKVARGRIQHIGVGHQRSEEHTSELQSPCNLVCRLLLEKKKKTIILNQKRIVTRSRTSA